MYILSSQPPPSSSKKLLLILQAVHCTEIPSQVFIGDLPSSEDPEDRGRLEAVTVIQTVNVLQGLPHRAHNHHPCVVNHPQRQQAFNSGMRGLLPLLNMSPPLFQLMILLGVEAATEVLSLTPFLHALVPPRLSKVVDVWPIGLKLSGSEDDGLLQAEKALAHCPYVRGVVVEGNIESGSGGEGGDIDGEGERGV